MYALPSLLSLLSFGHHGIVLILWIALFILAPLVVALIFHFEVSHSLSISLKPVSTAPLVSGSASLSWTCYGL